MIISIASFRSQVQLPVTCLVNRHNYFKQLIILIQVAVTEQMVNYLIMRWMRFGVW